MEWRAEKDLLQLRKETPIVWIVSPVDMSYSVPTDLDESAGSQLVLSACEGHSCMANTHGQ